MYKITTSQKTERFSELNRKVVSTFTKHNDVSYKLFNILSKFSEHLPNSLNNLITLSDMITDAIVISGRSSLSRSLLASPIIKNTLNINKESDTVSLAFETERDYSINVKKSYIQTPNRFTIFNKEKTSLSSFEEFLKGSPIILETEETFFKYTFALTLESKVTVSCIDIKLGSETDSYPLISEIYYINENNRKTYCTILNNSENSLDLDTDRQRNNSYTIFLPNIKTNRLYVTLEDKGKQSLSIDKIAIRRLRYAPAGELIIGPIVSTSPILKASLEALGDTGDCNFYISPDNETWYEIATPNEVSISKELRKIMSFNTVSRFSLKSEKDFKEFFIKIDMSRKLAKESEEGISVVKQSFGSNPTTTLPTNASETVVYDITRPVFYGDKTYKKIANGSEFLTPQFVKLFSQGSVYVQGFNETSKSVTEASSKLDSTLYSKALRIGGDLIDSTEIDPVTTTAYGFTVTTKDQSVNTRSDSGFVFKLKAKYPKDIYSIYQNNKEIKKDLSLGYIEDVLDAIIVTDTQEPIQVLDSTSREILTTTPKPFEDVFYISLIEEGLFETPLTDLILNTKYPLKRNEELEYSLSEGKLISKEHLVSFKQVSRVSTERIETVVELSKENGTNLKVVDERLKNKYTEYGEEKIEAFESKSVIKLKNKFIKKGTLVLSVREND